MPVKILYFAWVRERIGKAEEIIELPAGIAPWPNWCAWLADRGPEYANAFAKPEVIRTAIDRTHVKSTASLAGAREIAFFPPVTGG